jgi:hypothetical protein
MRTAGNEQHEIYLSYAVVYFKPFACQRSKKQRALFASGSGRFVKLFIKRAVGNKYNIPTRAVEFVKIDVYTNDKDSRVGEITNVHGSACEQFLSEDAEETT